MDLREYLYRKKIKQVDIARELRLNVGKLSIWVNNIEPFPMKHIKPLCDYLNLNINEFKKGNIKEKK